MRVRALKSFVSPFVSPLGAADEGEILDVPDELVPAWIVQGLVLPLELRAEPVETATRPAPETAVTRRPGRR
jgi:hypothetical protein